MKTLSTALAAPFAAGALALAVSSSVAAGTEPYFNPLIQSSAVASPNHINEKMSPWQAPEGISQTNLTSMAKIEADVAQSVVRVDGLGRGSSMWDMVAYSPDGKYIFIPHETAVGAGVTRYNIEEDFAEVLFAGDASAERGVESEAWANDFGAFDPATFTPYGTLLLGEEWSGEGRVMEVLNPFAPVDEIEVVEKQSFANVGQEGIRFGKINTNTVYYVDENRSGSIYKLVANDETFDQGQTFVLAVDAFDGDPSLNWDDEANADQVRLGTARWIPLTDAEGQPLTEQSPFDNTADADARSGRIAADQVDATPFGRPEDVEVGVLANGNEVLYFTATSEQTVYSVEMTDDANGAEVRVFAREDTTPKNAGFTATTAKINSPDNLAQDAFGNIYIIEDAPNSSNVGGDIWFVRDTDNDGVAESVDHFMSIQVNGAEATGMIFNPVEPSKFVVSVQHPNSTDLETVEGGQGDALWEFDISQVVPPVCNAEDVASEVTSCSSTADFNFISELVRTATPTPTVTPEPTATPEPSDNGGGSFAWLSILLAPIVALRRRKLVAK